MKFILQLHLRFYKKLAIFESVNTDEVLKQKKRNLFYSILQHVVQTVRVFAFVCTCSEPIAPVLGTRAFIILSVSNRVWQIIPASYPLAVRKKHIRIISLTNSSVHVYLLAFFPTFFCSFVFHSRVAKNSPKSNRTKGKKNKKMNERKFEREVSSINHRIAVRFQKERRLNGAALRATFGELRIGPQNLLSAIGCSAPTETDEKGKRRERKKRKRGYFAVAGRSKILTVTSSVCAEASRKT